MKMNNWEFWILIHPEGLKEQFRRFCETYNDCSNCPLFYYGDLGNCEERCITKFFKWKEEKADA